MSIASPPKPKKADRAIHMSLGENKSERSRYDDRTDELESCVFLDCKSAHYYYMALNDSVTLLSPTTWLLESARAPKIAYFGKEKTRASCALPDDTQMTENQSSFAG